MHNCETCQSELLSYLYDLVEASERHSLEEHLRSCPTCQAALDKARGQKSLLAVAAKAEFPNVRFQPPVEAEPAVLASPASVHASWLNSTWTLWALAASILFVLSLGMPAGWWYVRTLAL